MALLDGLRIINRKRFFAPMLLVLATLAGRSFAEPRNYAFDGTISREVLENYLSRSITLMSFLMNPKDSEDNIRMLKNIDAKFAGRTLFLWDGEGSLPQNLTNAKEIEAKVHAALPDLILQGAIFEAVSTEVNKLPIPAWAFEEFGLPPESRNFRYSAMLFPDGKFMNKWSDGSSVPDITRLETKLWFFYLAAEYIDAGCESIHWGQVALIGASDPTRANWQDVLSRARKYAKTHARRHLLLCDAHTPDGGPLFEGDKLLFDVHAFPLRIVEDESRPLGGQLREKYADSFYGRSKGGVTPSGWTCEHLPYLVEFDNFGTSGRDGEIIGAPWIWGYDEISWYARLSEEDRNAWLGYALGWLHEHDSNAFLEMPGARCLAAPVVGKDGKKIDWYSANTASDKTPSGFNQEEAIKALWAD
jgi:hypothetical protein